MTIRSHVDPCLFVVFMHIKHDDISENLADIVTALQRRHGESFNPVLERLDPRSRQIFFHETYHYWQGLRLPFLFRYAFLSFRQMFAAFKHLSIANNDFHQWSCFLPEMERLNVNSKIGFSPEGHIFWGGLDVSFPAETIQQLQLTPLDLLECATSLAEFQWCTRTEQLSDPIALRRWAKRNPAYLEPFDFAARFLGSESLALRTLLPLINASFHTTQPERAFAELLAHLWGNFVQGSEFSEQFLEQSEPCRWRDVFQTWLDKLEYEADCDFNAKIFSPTYFRLTLNYWVNLNFEMSEDKATHPFLGPVARRWCDSESSQPMSAWLIDQPGWVNKDIFWEYEAAFSPPISVFRFHLESGRDRVFMYGTGNIAGFTTIEDPKDSDNRGFIADLIAMYGAVRRASGAHYDETQRICYHSDCPEFKSNFCNSYTLIPDSFEVCGFPQRMKHLINLWSKPHDDTQN